MFRTSVLTSCHLWKPEAIILSLLGGNVSWHIGSLYRSTETLRSCSTDRLMEGSRASFVWEQSHPPTIWVHMNTHIHTSCSCWTCAFPRSSATNMGTETHSHLLAPAALANSDWWLPSGHHRLSITGALSKQTVHQQHFGRLCHTALVSTTFPHLCWLLDKDSIKTQ